MAVIGKVLTRVVRPLRRGQLTIPAEFRRRLGIGDDTLLQLTLRRDKIEVVPVAAILTTSKTWTRELYALFAPVRAEIQAMDEAEIDALIDKAVDEVRSQGYAQDCA